MSLLPNTLEFFNALIILIRLSFFNIIFTVSHFILHCAQGPNFFCPRWIQFLSLQVNYDLKTNASPNHIWGWTFHGVVWFHALADCCTSHSLHLTYQSLVHYCHISMSWNSEISPWYYPLGKKNIDHFLFAKKTQKQLIINIFFF